jgi:hypothetical protein
MKDPELVWRNKINLGDRCLKKGLALWCGVVLHMQSTYLHSQSQLGLCDGDSEDLGLEVIFSRCGGRLSARSFSFEKGSE